MKIKFLLSTLISSFAIAYDLSFDDNLLASKSDRKISSISCKPCNAGVEEVALMIAPSYDLKTVGEINVDFVWYRPPRKLKKYGSFFVDRNEGVREIFEQVASECKRIKYLAIASHGDLGSIALTNFDSIDVLNLDELFAGLNCVMAKDAIIDFQGCNVGRGCRGEDFMMKLGSLLLNKGGEIRANTNYSMPFFPHVLPHVSINLDRQILYINENFESFNWDNKPKTTEYCSKQIDKAINNLREINEKKCNLSEGKKKNLNLIINKLVKAKELNNMLGEKRYAFDEKNFHEARVFFDAFFYHNDFIEHLKSCK